jgi:hypothetical protein
VSEGSETVRAVTTRRDKYPFPRTSNAQEEDIHSKTKDKGRPRAPMQSDFEIIAEVPAVADLRWDPHSSGLPSVETGA